MSTHIQSKKIPLLGAVFVVQLVIAVVVLMSSQEQVSSVNEPLLAFDPEAVDRIVLEANEGDPLTLRKESERWVMADGLPVLPLRIDSIFESLQGLKTQWPVANTDAAAERFEVQDDNFNRKVTLYDGDQSFGSVLIGTSPSFNKSHVRRPGEDEVYALRLNAYDATNEKDHWLETTLLQPQGDLTKVVSGDYVLEKVDGQWVDQDSDAGDQEQQANTDSQAQGAEDDALNIAKFEEVLTTLRVIGVAEGIAEFDAQESESAGDDDNKINVIDWQVRTDQADYQYKMLSKDEQFYLRRNDYPQTFRISKYQYDNFAKIKKKSLSVAKN